MQQFDLAADALKLDGSMRHVLKKAKRQLIVSIPVKMDGGEVQVFEGYRVQHHIARHLPLSLERLKMSDERITIYEKPT